MARADKWAYTLGVVRDYALHHADRNLAILRAGGLNGGESAQHV